jgi:hypothetical protein
MLDLLFLQNDGAPLFFDRMLPYIQESAVADSVLAILFVRDINAETKEKREAAHARLSELGLVQWLTKAIQTISSVSFYEAAGELLVRIIEEASQVENGHLLLETLGNSEGKGKEQIDSFVQVKKKEKDESIIDQKHWANPLVSCLSVGGGPETLSKPESHC